MKHNNITCAGKSIADVSIITGAVETIRCVGTGSMFTASSVVLSAFIRICVIHRMPIALD